MGVKLGRKQERLGGRSELETQKKKKGERKRMRLRAIVVKGKKKEHSGSKKDRHFEVDIGLT